MKNKLLFTLLALLLTSPRRSQGTAIIIIVTPTGIVIGADGKQTQMVCDPCGPMSPTTKVFLMRGIALAGGGFTHASKGDITIYDFPEWAARIKENLPANITVGGLAHVVERESAKAFGGFDVLLKKAYIKREDWGTTLVAYYVVGYERAIPTIYEIRMDIDWDHQRLIGPLLRLMHPGDPGEGSREDWGVYIHGSTLSINHFFDRQSDAYKKAVAKAPVEVNTLLAQKDLTVLQAKKLIGILLQIETDANPTKVGPPFLVTTIKAGDRRTERK
jgi:hypothetical protein